MTRPVALGAGLSLLGIQLGFSLGGAFGVAEDAVKARLDASGTAVLATIYDGDVERKNSVVGRSWTYLQRAHLHGGAIGTASLASILALVLLCRAGLLVNLSALAFGAGAILYPLFWLLAGLKGPAMGGMGVAKDSLQFIAVPGAGLCILGLLGTLIAVAQAGFGPPRDIQRS